MFAGEMEKWERRRQVYRGRLREIYSFMIPPAQRVLEVGCGQGDLLAAVRPERVRGHSFGDADIPRVDAAILASLQRHNIQTFVWEERTFMQTANTLTLFPQTHAWLHTNFQPVRNFGIFQVWERQP